jgi:hypothetical protein
MTKEIACEYLEKAFEPLQPIMTADERLGACRLGCRHLGNLKDYVLATIYLLALVYLSYIRQHLY